MRSDDSARVLGDSRPVRFVRIAGALCHRVLTDKHTMCGHPVPRGAEIMTKPAKVGRCRACETWWGYICGK